MTSSIAISSKVVYWIELILFYYESRHLAIGEEHRFLDWVLVPGQLLIKPAKGN